MQIHSNQLVQWTEKWYLTDISFYKQKNVMNVENIKIAQADSVYYFDMCMDKRLT